ncbi:hypothetical protein [Saccharophagus degradans]|uniref:Carrier domain-containing protein n=2 Tax=Saccharophagus degradans TaxID=86304 RepID=A0AAW7X0H8_9GAMM|nr:hypothetical protein [Saccharophagus degradans]MDO6421230.1 hypothetical protein [Saccharophagus degradans]MDO6605859.1 hypothetical protein [Saccharophagus degradans]
MPFGYYSLKESIGSKSNCDQISQNDLLNLWWVLIVMSNTLFDSEKIAAFIKKNMVVFEEDEVVLKNDTNIFTSGFVNSMFAVMLLNFLETEYNIEVGDQDVILENFSSINAMERLVTRLQEDAHVV